MLLLESVLQKGNFAKLSAICLLSMKGLVHVTAK